MNGLIATPADYATLSVVIAVVLIYWWYWDSEDD